MIRYGTKMFNYDTILLIRYTYIQVLIYDLFGEKIVKKIKKKIEKIIPNAVRKLTKDRKWTNRSFCSISETITGFALMETRWIYGFGFYW